MWHFEIHPQWGLHLWKSAWQATRFSSLNFLLRCSISAWAPYLSNLSSSPQTSVNSCLLLSKCMGCRSRFLYQLALSTTVDAFVNVWWIRGLIIFVWNRTSKQNIARYWAKGNIFASLLCVCVYICICICMCVCICIYTESDWEYLELGVC